MDYKTACAKARRLSAKRQCIYFVYQGEYRSDYTVARDTPETEDWHAGETPAATYDNGDRID
jgi:hypothetical protein